MNDSTYIEFRVRGLHLDPGSNLPVLLLEDHGGRLLLPIWIGLPEASAIAAELEGQRAPRPMTHDLLRNVVAGLGAQVIRVDIRALEQGTFFADLWLETEDGLPVRIDCRPSDAIALAVRTGAPIRVAAPVLEAAQPVPREDVEPTLPPAPSEAVSADDDVARARLQANLARMDPNKMGKYKM